jgi:hypothetical protein
MAILNGAAEQNNPNPPAGGQPASPGASQGGQPASPAASQGGLQVKVTDEVLKGVYANMVQVGHTPEEFILDFINLFPPTGIVSARVIISPQHAKRIAAALLDNVKKYEEQFGAIKASTAPEHKIGFRTE